MLSHSDSTGLQLRRGQELSSWPWVKVRLARSDSEALQTMVDVWNLEHPARLSGTLEDNGRRAVFTVSVVPTPPLTHWSAHVGGAVAAMRAALDPLAWQAANLGETEPRKPQRLSFPFLAEDDAKGWKEWDQNVPDMEEELRSRFHAVAGLRGGEVGRALSVLTTLNNVDKHRSSLVLSPLSNEGHLRVEFDLGELQSKPAEARLIPLMFPGSRMEVGAEVLAVEWDHAFASLRTSAAMETTPWLDVALEGEPESLAPALPVLSTLHAHVSSILHFICTGQAPEGPSIGNDDLSEHLPDSFEDEGGVRP